MPSTFLLVIPFFYLKLIDRYIMNPFFDSKSLTFVGKCKLYVGCQYSERKRMYTCTWKT